MSGNIQGNNRNNHQHQGQQPHLAAHPPEMRPGSSTSGNSNMTGRSPFHPSSASAATNHRRRSSRPSASHSHSVLMRSAFTDGTPTSSAAFTNNTSLLTTPASSVGTWPSTHTPMTNSGATPGFANMSLVNESSNSIKLSSNGVKPAVQRNILSPLGGPKNSTSSASEASREFTNPGAEPDHLLRLRQLTWNSLFSSMPSPKNAVMYGEILYATSASQMSPTCVDDALLYAHALFRNQEYKRCLGFMQRAGSTSGGLPLLPYCSEKIVFDKTHSITVSPRKVLEATLLACRAWMALLEYEEAQVCLDCTVEYLIKTLVVPSASNAITGVPPLSSTEPFVHPVIPSTYGLTVNQVQEITLIQEELPLIEQNTSLNRTNHGDKAVLQLHPAFLFLVSHFVADSADSIHPLAQFSTLYGQLYDALHNPHKASKWLQAALLIDFRCMEAFRILMDRSLLTVHRQWQIMDTLFNVDEGTQCSTNQWLRDWYISQLGASRPIESQLATSNPHLAVENVSTASVHQITGLSISHISLHRSTATDSSLRLNSSRGGKHLLSPFETQGVSIQEANEADEDMTASEVNRNASKDLDEIDQAFSRLTTHSQIPFCHTPTLLAYAAQRAYNCHNLGLAAALCARTYAIDPLCPLVTYVHMATLVGLQRKRELFYLSHQLVQAHPKQASSWFAVGCYYHLCQKFDMAQRHFCRATRLEPKCSVCWIGFGNSFAAADESDQALAAYRASQRCDSGNTVPPWLYMGMEYLRTNHVTLAKHFLETAQTKGAAAEGDPLVYSELAVCAYRMGRLEDAIMWGIEAMEVWSRLEQKMHTLAQLQLSENWTSVIESVVAMTSMTKQISHNVNGNGKHPKEFNQKAVKHRLSCVISCTDTFWEPTITNLGHSFLQIRDFESAVVCYQKALQLCPQIASSYTSLGLAQQMIGDLDGAICSYHKALEIKPNDASANEMLSRAMKQSLRQPFSESFPEEKKIFSQQATPEEINGQGIRHGQMPHAARGPPANFSFGSSANSIRSPITPASALRPNWRDSSTVQRSVTSSRIHLTENSNLSFDSTSDIDMS